MCFVLLVVGGAVAQSPAFVGVTKEAKHRFLNDVEAYKGVKLGGTGATIPNSYTGSVDYDFTELSNVALGTPCALGPSVTVTGAVFGDACMASFAHITKPVGVTLDCFVSAANAAKVQLCVQFTDAGVYDAEDAGFRLRTLGR